MIPIDVSSEVAERFWSKVKRREGCWEWTATITAKGYGHFSVAGRMALAHRWAYIDAYGWIPHGMTLDHLCRNRRCVNPDHLQPVSMRVNILRGEGITAENARKTYCSRGHPFNEENTYVEPSGRGRDCRACIRRRGRERHRRKTAKEVSA